MCSECYNSPHLPNCPNAPEPEAIYICDHCGEGIVEGDEYVTVDGNCYHVDCISNMSVEELGEIFGFSIKTALGGD